LTLARKTLPQAWVLVGLILVCTRNMPNRSKNDLVYLKVKVSAAPVAKDTRNTVRISPFSLFIVLIVFSEAVQCVCWSLGQEICLIRLLGFAPSACRPHHFMKRVRLGSHCLGFSIPHSDPDPFYNICRNPS